jgi:hypothetical protein
MQLILSSNLLSHAYAWHATKYTNTIAFTDMYHIKKKVHRAAPNIMDEQSYS